MKVQNESSATRREILSVIQELYWGDGLQDKLADSSPSDWDKPVAELAATLGRPIFRQTTTFDYDRAVFFDILLPQPAMEVLELTPTLYPPTFAYTTSQIEAMRGMHKMDFGSLMVSSVSQYYTFCVNRTVRGQKHGWVSESVSPFGDLGQYASQQAIIMSFFKSRSLQLLSDRILRSRVLNVSLELSEPEQETVFKCLFSDYEAMPGELIYPPIN